MEKTQDIPLQLSVTEALKLEVVEIFIEPHLPFSVVYYSLNGEMQEYGLRLDLDKMAFLDLELFMSALGPDKAQTVADACAEKVVQAVYDWKHPQTLTNSAAGDY